MTLISKIIDKIFLTLLCTLCFLVPVFYLPINNQFALPKQALLSIGLLTLISVSALKSIAKKDLTIKYSPTFSAPLALITASYLLSSLVSSDRYHSILISLIFLALFLLFHLIISVDKFKEGLKNLLLISSAAASSILIFELLDKAYSLGYFPSPPVSPIAQPLISYPIQRSLFSPIGSIFMLFIFLLGISPLAIHVVSVAFSEIKKGMTLKNLVLFTISSLTLIGLLLSLITIAPKKEGNPNSPIILPLDYSYKISIASLGLDFKSAVTGFGPYSFENVFNFLKPKEINLGDKLWLYRFSSSGSAFLESFTTIGLIGTISFLYLLLKACLILLDSSRPKNALLASILLILFLQLIFPVSISSWFLLIVLLAIYEKDPKDFVRSKVWPVSLLLFIFTLPFFYFSITFFSNQIQADQFYQKSLNLTPPIDLIKAMELQQAAINLNPYESEYLLSLAQTQFLTANSLYRKADKTTSEDEAVQKYVEASLGSSKKATEINPQNSRAWHILALTYKNFYRNIQDSDSLTITTFQKFLSLEPANPAGYVEFAQFYYTIKAFDKSEEMLQKAIDVKPDYSVAFHNLAYVLVQQDKMDEAIKMLEKAMSLLDKKDPNYIRAATDKNTIEKAISQQNNSSQKPTLNSMFNQESSPSGTRKVLILIPEESPRSSTMSGNRPSPTPGESD